MPKKRKPVRGRRPAPPIFSPVVTQNPPEATLTDSAFAALEKVGKIILHTRHRSDLVTLAEVWIGHDQTLQSARPGPFRSRLKQIGVALEEARIISDINANDAPELDRHLLIWAINVPGASKFWTELLELHQQIKAIEKTLTTLQSSIPADYGKDRPYNDAGMIGHLADIFEAAAGKPSVYWSDGQSAWADTPFRRFAHEFYSQLPLIRRRTSSGLDNTLKTALSQRRNLKKG